MERSFEPPAQLQQVVAGARGAKTESKYRYFYANFLVFISILSILSKTEKNQPPEGVFLFFWLLALLVRTAAPLRMGLQEGSGYVSRREQRIRLKF